MTDSAPGDWPTVVDEIHQLTDGDKVQFVRIQVTTDSPWPTLTLLGSRLAETIRQDRP